MIHPFLKRERCPACRTLRAGFVATGILAAGLSLAAPGDLDPSFNTTGKRLIGFNVLPPIVTGANAVALQTDGKIVLAIRREVLDHPTFALMRLNSDGSTDTTFSGGVVVRDLSPAEGEALAVAVQGDGKIVAAGFGEFDGHDDFVVARFNPDGTPDTGFGGDRAIDGVAIADFGPDSEDAALSVVLQKDGKIVAGGLAGEPGDSDFALARFTSAGRLDSSFDTDGRVTTAFVGFDLIRSLAIQSDGRIVAAGFTQALDSDFEVARYNANGSLDRSFSRDGKLTTNFGGDDRPNSVVVQKDGKILVGGFSQAGTGARITLARYQRSGKLDRSLDRDGKLITDLGVPSLAFGVAAQNDGKIVAAGAAASSTNVDFLLARFQKNGRLDLSFGTNGFLTTDFGAQDLAMAVALTPDGRIVAAGSSSDGSDQIAVARYLPR